MSSTDQDALKVSISPAAVVPAVELAVANPLSGALQTVQDEDGNNSALRLATNSLNVGAAGAAALFQAFPPSVDPNGPGFVIGNMATTNLRMGFDIAGGYSWIQSHNSQPLYINTVGNTVSIGAAAAKVGIGTKAPTESLHVNGTLRVAGLPVATVVGLAAVYVDGNGKFYRQF